MTLDPAIFPIKIDLRDLTKEHIAEAMPNQGGSCMYRGPCIIGTLVPEEHRADLDKPSSVSTSIDWLIEKGLVTMPEDQKIDAIAMQQAFDMGYTVDWLPLASSWAEQAKP